MYFQVPYTLQILNNEVSELWVKNMELSKQINDGNALLLSIKAERSNKLNIVVCM